MASKRELWRTQSLRNQAAEMWTETDIRETAAESEGRTAEKETGKEIDRKIEAEAERGGEMAGMMRRTGTEDTAVAADTIADATTRHRVHARPIVADTAGGENETRTQSGDIAMTDIIVTSAACRVVEAGLTHLDLVTDDAAEAEIRSFIQTRIM
jgi:hypothetical protein